MIREMYLRSRAYLKKMGAEYTTVQPLPENSVAVHWWRGRPNIGDALNPVLLQALSHMNIEWVPNNSNIDYLMCVGSVVQSANDKAQIWGAGLISENWYPTHLPREVKAVRGPKTRDALRARGIPCPEIFGDPALLMPRVFEKKSPASRYKLGLIPHFVDKADPKIRALCGPDVLMLDVESNNVLQFLSDLWSCERVVSSSLHGIVLADAYGIPASRMKLSSAIVGGDFKFDDYYLGIGRKMTKPLNISSTTKMSELCHHVDQELPPTITTSALLAACPISAS